MSPDYIVKPRFAEIRRPFVVPIIDITFKYKNSTPTKQLHIFRNSNSFL